MLLYIYLDGTLRQVEENPSVADLVAVSQGLLRIVKEAEKGFLLLVKDQDKLTWVPVKDSKVAISKDVRLHI